MPVNRIGNRDRLISLKLLVPIRPSSLEPIVQAHISQPGCVCWQSQSLRAQQLANERGKIPFTFPWGFCTHLSVKVNRLTHLSTKWCTKARLTTLPPIKKHTLATIRPWQAVAMLITVHKHTCTYCCLRAAAAGQKHESLQLLGMATLNACICSLTRRITH
jgi:hypothetical protein